MTSAGLACTITITGPAGSAVTGDYLCSAKRASFSSSLPFSATYSGLSRFEVHKVRSADEVYLTAQKGGVTVSSSAPSGVPGLVLLLEDGIEIQTLSQ